MSLFGRNLGSTEKKTGTLFGSTTAPTGGLFAQSQQPKPSQSGLNLFGSSTAQPQNTGSVFGNSQQQNAGSSMFQPQQQPMRSTLFGGMLQPAPDLPPLQASQMRNSQQSLPQFRQTTDNGQREKSVVEQMNVISNKWNPTHPDCVFSHYLYNQVDPDKAPYYGPQPHEDERKWEEALAKKPGPGSIPLLVRGFQEMAQRIMAQSMAVNLLQQRLHELNDVLVRIKNAHETETFERIQKARQRHVVHMQKTLALATKMQILRNRGYSMDQAEEELKKKLSELEKKTFDPVLSGRQEEIWARMSGVRERARLLQQETEKLAKTVEGQQNGDVLSEEDQKQIEKLLKDYDKQLAHLKKWVDDTKEEYNEWEQDRKQAKASGAR